MTYKKRCILYAVGLVLGTAVFFLGLLNLNGEGRKDVGQTEKQIEEERQYQLSVAASREQVQKELLERQNQQQAQEAQALRKQMEERQRHLQLFANNFVRDITYIKDSRANINLCFAYYWQSAQPAIVVSSSYGRGPAIATVPCEAVPPELLIVAKWAH